jgi:uncharacterized protein YggE
MIHALQGEKKMSRKAKLLSSVVLLAIVLAGCTRVQASTEKEPGEADVVKVYSSTTQSARSITVVGVGKVSLKPNIVTVSFGVETRASTVAEAKAEVDAEIAAVVAALQKVGIAEKDIQTLQYSIHRDPEPVPMMSEGSALTDQGGYLVYNVLRVTVRDIEKAGTVLDTAVEAGANQVWGVNLTVSDEDKWQGQAREKAMADARARAADLAGLAGVELGEVLSISEVIGALPVPMAVSSSGMGGGGIAPGELELATQIQVTFAIQ